MSWCIYLNIWQDTIYHTKPVCHNHWCQSVSSNISSSDEVPQLLHTVLHANHYSTLPQSCWQQPNTNYHQLKHPSCQLLPSQYYMFKSACMHQSTRLRFQSSIYRCWRFLCFQYCCDIPIISASQKRKTLDEEENEHRLKSIKLHQGRVRT